MGLLEEGLVRARGLRARVTIGSIVADPWLFAFPLLCALGDRVRAWLMMSDYLEEHGPASLGFGRNPEGLLPPVAVIDALCGAGKQTLRELASDLSQVFYLPGGLQGSLVFVVLCFVFLAWGLAGGGVGRLAAAMAPGDESAAERWRYRLSMLRVVLLTWLVLAVGWLVKIYFSKSVPSGAWSALAQVGFVLGGIVWGVTVLPMLVALAMERCRSGRGPSRTILEGLMPVWGRLVPYFLPPVLLSSLGSLIVLLGFAFQTNALYAAVYRALLWLNTGMSVAGGLYLVLTFPVAFRLAEGHAWAEAWGIWYSALRGAPTEQLGAFVFFAWRLLCLAVPFTFAYALIGMWHPLPVETTWRLATSLTELGTTLGLTLASASLFVALAPRREAT